MRTLLFGIGSGSMCCVRAVKDATCLIDVEAPMHRAGHVHVFQRTHSAAHLLNWLGFQVAKYVCRGQQGMVSKERHLVKRLALWGLFKPS